MGNEKAPMMWTQAGAEREADQARSQDIFTSSWGPQLKQLLKDLRLPFWRLVCFKAVCLFLKLLPRCSSLV